jgi:hypothetical protein
MAASRSSNTYRKEEHPTPDGASMMPQIGIELSTFGNKASSVAPLSGAAMRESGSASLI